MPRGRHPLEETIRRIIADEPDLGPDRIRAGLEELVRRGDLETSQLPGTATIGRIKARFKKEEHAAYKSYQWPESHEPPTLIPWEAAASLMELMRVKGTEVSNREAVWFWRITLARPEASLDDRWDATGLMAFWYDTMNQDAKPARLAEAFLLFGQLSTSSFGLGNFSRKAYLALRRPASMLIQGDEETER